MDNYQKDFSYSPLRGGKLIFISLVFFIAFCGWSSLELDIDPWGNSIFAIIIGIFLFGFSLLKYSCVPKDDITTIVTWTIFSAFLSSIPAFFDWGTDIFRFIKSFVTLFYGLAFFYLLKIWRVNPSSLIKLITLFCIVWVAIEIGQQFTYPNYWFAGRGEDNTGNVENRMGLWRFYIWGVDFVMIAWCFFYGKLYSLKNKSLVNYLLVVLFAVGLLCYGSRKHIMALFFSIAAGFLFSGKIKNKFRIGFVCFLVSLVIIYYFGEAFIEMSAEQDEMQGAGEDFIRWICANYFINDFSQSVLYPFFGSGYGGKVLSDYLEFLKTDYHFYQADIGIIGYYSQVGLIGVSAIILYIYKFIQNWKYIDIEYKLFFIMKMVMIVFDFWMMWAVGIVAYGTFLYMLDENINKNKFIQNNEI